MKYIQESKYVQVQKLRLDRLLADQLVGRGRLRPNTLLLTDHELALLEVVVEEVVVVQPLHRRTVTSRWP